MESDIKKIKKIFCFVALFCLSATAFSAALGDVNSDNNINIVDALMVAQYAVGIQPANFNAGAADVNADGSVTIVDALMIAQYSVGLIAAFSAEMTLYLYANDDIGGTGGGYVTISPVSLEKKERIDASYLMQSTYVLHFPPNTAVTFSGFVSGRASFYWQSQTNPVTLTIKGGETLTGYFSAPDPSPTPITTRTATAVPTNTQNPTPARTATPTSTPTVHGDNYYYTQHYQYPGNIVVLDDNGGSMGNTYFCNTGSIITWAEAAEVPGYTGDGYIKFTGLPSTLYFWVSIPAAGTYNLGLRSFNSVTNSWEFGNGINPLSVNLTANLYIFTFAIPSQNYLLDRIVIYPAGTAAAVWQDLTHPMAVTFTGGDSTQIAFSLQ